MTPEVFATPAATTSLGTPALLHLLYLASPALPVGAYAYSQGLEYAIDSQTLKTPEAVADWLSHLLQDGLGALDLPLLLRLYTAFEHGNSSSLNHWNNELRAFRETGELLLEDEQMGEALWRLLDALNAPQLTPSPVKPCFATAFARAGYHFGIKGPDLATAFAFSWLENQVAAATKLLPLGQTQAQKLLLQLLPAIPQAVAAAVACQDGDLGQSLPGLAEASSRHEHQYSRLFRS
jgi:urease accessory protein